MFDLVSGLIGAGASLLGGLLGGSSEPDVSTQVIQKPPEYTDFAKLFIGDWATTDNGQRTLMASPYIAALLGYQNIFANPPQYMPTLLSNQDLYLAQAQQAGGRPNKLGYPETHLSETPYLGSNQTPPVASSAKQELAQPVYMSVLRDFSKFFSTPPYITIKPDNTGKNDIRVPAFGLLNSYVRSLREALTVPQAYMQSFALPISIMDAYGRAVGDALRLGGEAWLPLNVMPIATPSTGQILSGSLLGLGQSLLGGSIGDFLLNRVLSGVR